MRFRYTPASPMRGYNQMIYGIENTFPIIENIANGRGKPSVLTIYVRYRDRRTIDPKFIRLVNDRRDDAVCV